MCFYTVKGWVLTPKKRVNRDKTDFATKLRMFGPLIIDEGPLLSTTAGRATYAALLLRKFASVLLKPYWMRGEGSKQPSCKHSPCPVSFTHGSDKYTYDKYIVWSRQVYFSTVQKGVCLKRGYWYCKQSYSFKVPTSTESMIKWQELNCVISSVSKVFQSEIGKLLN